MSSSKVSIIETPCLNNKLVYFSDRGKSLYICLKEDKYVEVHELEQGIREVLGSRGKELLGLSHEDIVKRVVGFLIGLEKSIKDSIEKLLDEEVIDISLPRVSESKINPGEFVGDFVIYSSGEYRIVLHVEPKIGWSGYRIMLQETMQSIDVIASQTGMLEPLLGNLYYPSLSSLVSYSILLLRLTNLVLSSSPPKKTTSVKVVSEGVVGRPVIPDTLKYVWQGLPLGVYERVRIEVHDYPFMLLARFHYDLYNALKNPLERLGDILEFEEHTGSGFYGLITSGIKRLLDLHSYYLTTPPLSSYLDVLFREDIGIQELLNETRRTTRVNPYFGILADLYEMYSNDIGLIHEYMEKGMIVPCASSKIYELWILTRIIEFLRKLRGGIPELKVDYEDLYAKFLLETLQLEYNVRQPIKVFKELRIGSILRPDFVVKKGSGGEGGVVVYDAKYREKITREDVETMLLYIMEYAKPLTINGKKKLLGVFYKLRWPEDPENPEKSYEPRYAIKNTELPVNIEVYAYPLHPGMDYNTINEYIYQSLQPLLESA